ncbi:LuxR family transcriptional regulator [Kribbella antibiotica]|uniref:LuxR family transcriptional regulator n=1 Tax=Kribbella antibiotica TaxID=190195 RepID=A0A4R4ZMZ7_9ACTN|nr:LuxR family transcriptional regulator [Kribbella antibiotica]TDD59650.1 LuxR family transcriptional regulator [Kribbella antibiotica]
MNAPCVEARRDHELGVLHDALTKDSGLILVVGESGVGKTHLLRQVASHHSVPWFITQCLAGTSSLDALLEVLGVDAADADRRGAVLRGLARLGPIVLAVEDLQWADPETLRLVRFIATRIPPGVHLVVTCRPEATESALMNSTPSLADRITEVQLDPLDASEVQAVAAHQLGGHQLSLTLAEELTRHSGGLPFAVLEFLRAIKPSSTVERDVRRALVETAPPVALRASLGIRMREVPESCRHVVRAAAVLTTAAPEYLLGTVAGLTGPTLTAAIDHALTTGLLHERRPGLYDHRHTLARRAVLSMLPPDELRRLHRQAARALMGITPPPNARIAEHARRGGLLGTWMTHAELAADHLIAGGNVMAAADQFSAMLDVSALPWTDRARLATKLGRATLADSTRWGNSISVLGRVLGESAIPGMARGRLRLMLGLLLHNRAGDIRAGRRELFAAVQELDGDPGSIAWALSALAVPTYGGEPFAQQRVWLRQARSLVHETVDGTTRYAVRTNEALFRLATGELDPAPGAEAAGARAWLGQRQTFADAEPDRYSRAVVAAAQVRVAFAAADWATLEERLTRARAAAEGLPLVLAELDLIDGRHRLARGDVATGKGLLTAVIARTTLGPLPLHAAAVAACPDADYEHALDVVRRKGLWAVSSDLVIRVCTAWMCTGRVEDATRLADEFAEAVGDVNAPAAAAAAALVDAVVRPSVAAFGQAAAQYGAIGWQYYECLAREQLGLHLLSTGEAEHLTTTARAYDALGARGDGERCRGALRAAGFAAPRKRGRRGYNNKLSPRELEVARLAAQGLTNREIASRLKLSVSTIEDHITSTFRKLGVARRSALGPLL